MLQQPSSASIRCLSSSSTPSTAISPPITTPTASNFLREDPERRGTALIMDGTAAAAEWEREMAAEVRSIVNGDDSSTSTSSTSSASTTQRRRPPSLAVVLVGDRPDSVLYVTRKLEAAARVGVDAAAIRLPEDIERRLAALAEATGRTKTFYAREAILGYLDDLEDIYLAERALEEVRAGRVKTTSLDEVMREHGLEH